MSTTTRKRGLDPADNECPTKKQNNGIKSYLYQLTEKPDTVEWKTTYYVYVEKKGHFKETAKAAWDQFFANVDKLDAQVTREKHLSQYRMDVDPWVYRAGYTVSSKPTSLPNDFHCIELDGGSYLRFVLTGSYEHLGEACGRVFDIVGKEYEHQQRKDWNMEYYVNDMKQVKSEELVTEILIPIYPSPKCEDAKSASTTYQLTEKPDVVEWEPCYFVYVEKKGHFKETAQAAWSHFMAHVGKIDAQVTRVKHISQYSMDVDPWVYRAGYIVSAKPATLPDDFHCIEFPGGSHLRFILTGGYHHLEAACQRVWDIVGKEYEQQRRKDWNMEYYVNDMKKVKPEELMTEILIPIHQSKCEHNGDTSSSTYQLTETPDVVEWKPCYFVYVEKKGHFKETARAAWGHFMTHVDKIDAQVTRVKHISQYRMDVEPWLYRAGYIVSAKPTTLPDDFHCIEFPGGSYLRFILTGGYQHLEAACKRVWDIVGLKYPHHRKYDWNMEYYVNDMKKVKSEELMTEILIPIKPEKVKEEETKSNYQLSEKPEYFEWKPCYFVYCEREGHFLHTAHPCWEQFFANVAKIDAQVKREKHVCLYRFDVDPWIYRAGYTVNAKPTTLPEGYHVIEFPGGHYLRWILNGLDVHLADACSRVFAQMESHYSSQKRKDFNIEYKHEHQDGTYHLEICIPVNKSEETEMLYQLTETPDTVEWKQSHFVYCEQSGDFYETAKSSWEQFFGSIGKLDALVKRDKLVSQFRIDTKPHVFRAGATIPSAPTGSLPDGYALTEISGGSYLRFVFTGEFSELPEARDRVFELVKKNHAHQVKHDGWMLQYHLFGTKNTELLVPTT